MKKIVSILVLALIMPTVLFAESVPPLPATEPIQVASVNIQDAAIDSFQNNVFTLSFTLTNGVGMQSGVRYGVRLASLADGKEVIADEKVYSESLTLLEHSSTKRQITYTAPSQLQGQFMLYVTSQNSKGFPYGITSLGKVSLTAATQGVFVDPQSCVASSGTATTSIAQPLTIKENSELQLQCVVTNSTSGALTLTPTIETRDKSVYGEVVEQQGGESSGITIAGGEKKTIQLILPVAAKPRSYVALVALASTSLSSNTVTVPYIISGTTATVENLTFDKQAYQKGDTAQATLLYVSNALAGGSASIALADHAGKSCAEPVTQPLSEDTPIVMVSIPITASCTGPQASVTILDKNGTALDAANFSLPASRSMSPLAALGVLLGIVVLLGILLIVVKKRKLSPPAVTAVVLLFFFIPVVHAHANTYTYTSSGYRGQMQLVANIDNSTYALGAPINITASITSQSADTWPIYLSVSTNNGPLVTIFSPSSLAPYTSTANATAQLSAPTANGNYSVDFRVGKEDRLIMGSTSSFATSAIACTNGDPYSHSYYQALPYNPNGPSTGSYLYLGSYYYETNQPYGQPAGGWLAMHYMYSGLTSYQYWQYVSPTYAVQVGSDGKILGSITCP